MSRAHTFTWRIASTQKGRSFLSSSRARAITSSPKQRRTANSHATPSTDDRRVCAPPGPHSNLAQPEDPSSRPQSTAGAKTPTVRLRYGAPTLTRRQCRFSQPRLLSSVRSGSRSYASTISANKEHLHILLLMSVRVYNQKANIDLGYITLSIKKGLAYPVHHAYNSISTRQIPKEIPGEDRKERVGVWKDVFKWVEYVRGGAAGR